MNRVDFGRLIASLRVDLGWSQVALAEYAEIDVAMLSNIERGAKKFFEPDLLFRLANVLQLTSLERREFFLAACGLDQDKMVRQPSGHTPTDVFDSEKLLGQLSSTLSALQVPAMIGDAYGDVVAANALFVAFWQGDDALIAAMQQDPDMFNTMHFVYAHQHGRKVFGENADWWAVAALRDFREGSLRYRTRPRYIALMEKLRQHPLFEQHWRKVSTLGVDKPVMLDPIETVHDTFGALRVITTSTVCLTPYGELFITHYSPIDHQTAVSFLAMSEKLGDGVVRFSAWPRE